MSAVVNLAPAENRRVAGFWMSSPCTLSYETEDGQGRRVVANVEFDSAEQASVMCADAIRAVSNTVRNCGVIPSRRAVYLSAVADLIADWVNGLGVRGSQR